MLNYLPFSVESQRQDLAMLSVHIFKDVSRSIVNIVVGCTVAYFAFGKETNYLA
jgi:hypothetical protein